MKKNALVVMGLVLVSGLLIKPAWAMSCHGGDGMNMSHDEQKNTDKNEEVESFSETVYSCPMHPEVRSDQPGKCPKCGMNLEAKQVTKYRLKKDRPAEQATMDQNTVSKDKSADNVQNNTGSGAPVEQRVVRKEKTLTKPASPAKLQKGSGSAVYQCPMHPEVTGDKPGKCPKCGMFLEKK